MASAETEQEPRKKLLAESMQPMEGVVYVLMDETNETKLFSARADEDA
jgi:hypothetical protein